MSSMKKYILISLILLMCSTVFSQLSNTHYEVGLRIEKSISGSDSEDKQTMYDIRQNAVYNMDVLLFCYERIIPLKEKVGLTATGGVLIWDPFNLVGEVGTIYFGPRHFAEVGVGFNFNPFDSEWNMPFFRAGYRLQLKKGFMVKASGAYVTNPLGAVVPLLGLGYAF